MENMSKYAVGLDIGTSTVRVVVGYIDETTGVTSIVGAASEDNNGMRKGTVVNLNSVAQAVDKALENVERTSGHQIESASVSINGSHVVGISSRGVIAVGPNNHEITLDDVRRVEEAATVLQLPANREIIEVTPRSYQLDGQDNIKDPLGMTGVRLEVDAHVITALAPMLKNLEKVCDMVEIRSRDFVLAGLASARAVLKEQQMENGVLLIDIGSNTTNLIVFDEGDLQHVAVLPVGGNNITNDLAIGLRTDLDIAEKVKLTHAVAHSDLRRGNDKNVSIKVDKKTYEFEIDDIDMIVDARLEETFEQINNELKSIGRCEKLPGGVVITGGGANLKGIADYAKQALGLSVKIGKPEGFDGINDQINNPSFAVATGLMMADLTSERIENYNSKKEKNSDSVKWIRTLHRKVTVVIGKFRS